MQNHQKESKRGHQGIQQRNHTRNDRDIKKPEESPKRAEARPRQTDPTLRQAGYLLSYHDQGKITEIIEECHTKLSDSEPSTIIHTDPKEKNGVATGYDHITKETVKAGEDTMSKTLAKPYTKCLSKSRIPTAWKNTKMMISYKKGNTKDHNNYRLIVLRLLSNIYEALTKVLTNRLEKALDESQPREQAGSRSRYSEADIRKQILNDRPYPRRKPTEGQVQRI